MSWLTLILCSSRYAMIEGRMFNMREIEKPSLQREQRNAFLRKSGISKLIYREKKKLQNNIYFNFYDFLIKKSICKITLKMQYLIQRNSAFTGYSDLINFFANNFQLDGMKIKVLYMCIYFIYIYICI
ncbi:hypothetical protein PUN28_018644 [Cardiocondyla obscurior]|uniref:Transmembrane protein n=1 Tax=Cardiocondyla obscurior TaxID=286306 RepID=A0AAW2EGA3_9HYME